MYQSNEQRTKSEPDEWKECEDMHCYEQAKQMDPDKIPYQGLVHPKFRQKGHVERVSTIGMSTTSSTTHVESSSRITPGNSNWNPTATTGATALEGQCTPKAMTIGSGEGNMGLGTSVGGNYEGTVKHARVRKGLGGDLVEEPDIGWIYELLE